MNSTKTPLILVTNDDGYFAPGLKALIDVASQFGDVIAVAPEVGASGMSHAITIKVPLRASVLPSESHYKLIKVNGTPADCVKLALNQLLPRRPDVVISGINHGSNSSVSILYSGTMGAALEGCLNGIPSIGFSLCSHSMNADFALSKEVAKTVLGAVLKQGLPDATCLNVNVPVTTIQEFNGIKICRQAKGMWKEEFEKRTDPHGGDYFWLTGDFHNSDNGATDTDEWALKHNFASVVPVKTDLTNFDALDTLVKMLPST